MPLATNYLGRLNALRAEVIASYEALNRKQSENDREVAAIHREIEDMWFEDSRLFERSARLQEVLRQNRVVKDEMASLSAVYRLFDRMSDPLAATEASCRRSLAKTEEIRRDLHVTLTIDDIGVIAR